MPSTMQPALGLLELDSIAAGIAAGDAMAKRAPIDVIYAGTIHPGRYLVLVAGSVADVEEAVDAGQELGAGCVLDVVLLPHVHPDVVAGVRGVRLHGEGDALGVIETPTVASIIDAADAGMKGARVRLLELRLADGLGGKGYLLFDGAVSDVEAAVEAGVARAHGARVTHRVIARLHHEMRENLEAAGRFRDRVVGGAGPDGSPGGTGTSGGS
jgi:bacterial microcompartment shell protein